MQSLQVPEFTPPRKPLAKRRTKAHLIYPHYPGVPDDGFAKVTLATLAAMLSDSFELTVTDEIDCGMADLEIPADVAFLIALTGHEGRIAELYKEFAARGVLVVVGGPLASMSPERLRPHCDVLVKGEIDDHYQELFEAIATGTHEDEYTFGIASMERSPIPRWDLLPSRHRDGAIQASRGCPYRCEFCLSAKYAGREMRHKSAEQLRAELTNLYNRGYRFVNFTDDNFTMHPRIAKSLLREIADWNSQQTAGECSFMLMASINAAKDLELLEHLRDANVRTVFSGIETPIEQSLRDAKKVHNVAGPPMLELLRRFAEYGIMSSIGMTAGFDADPPDIFERQLEFIEQSGVPIVRGGLLGAIHNSDLYLRLRKEGREVDESFMQYPTWMNFEPKVMSREKMKLGLKWLLSQVYAPKAFGDRMTSMVETMLESEHSKLSIPANAETFLMDRMRKRFELLESLGAGEIELAARAERFLSEVKESVAVVLPIISGYLYYRKSFSKLGLFRPDLAGVALADLFAESETQLAMSA